ncbi:threonine--tRNA ligase [Mesoterricola silvestris]|uniref:Threonine--tRNA ligase n=1 Tax=Mesoterricola silvestris TaxID=2927979 RepID=A0AA48GVK7_9BACT|nr:threonine--tRNA ligase [Mesoterricola silvestris]BDU74867.1 threonine--tRNA ligase [Mesoterricola silvestris]
MAVSVRLPDDSIREMPDGATGADLALAISPRLLDAALAMRVDGRLMDLRTPLAEGSRVAVVTSKDPESIDVIRHSAAHLLAQAVKRLFPKAKVGIGPVIEDGFYYDFMVDPFFTPEDLVAIEAEMRRLSQEAVPVLREELGRDQAVALFQGLGEGLKVELVSDIPADERISGYRQGDFYDLCRGPHVPDTGKLKAFKLLNTAAAYWKGDEKNAQLCRIYGTAFHTAKELEEHLRLLEEARTRDHRKLGKELGLFSFHPEAPASPFFHPKGTIVYNELVNYMRSLYARQGYSEVITPQALDVALWKTSGHYDHYVDNMYFTTVDEREYALKPMNCPSHCLIFGNGRHSYRDLPIRYADFGRLHRYERSGVTHGLTRVRTFCQDDAHIYCMPEQMKEEMASFLDFIRNVYHTFGFDELRVNLSTRPESRLGSDEIWDHAEGALASALDEAGMPYNINAGDGAFYGPKIDFQVLDALKRPWQLGTLQVDYSMPSRFGLIYVKADGSEGQPVMLHRAILGSLERFMGILIEHCAGAFPTWLAPVQVAILPITDRAHDYARAIRDRALDLGVRVELDLRNEKVNAKIRDAQLSKVPYMLVLGDREAAAGTVSVRHRHRGDLGAQPLDGFFDALAQEIRTRAR